MNTEYSMTISSCYIYHNSLPVKATYTVYIYNNLLHTLRAHCVFSHTCSVKFQSIFHTLYFMVHHARISTNVILTTVIEIVEILDGRVRIAFS